MRQDQYRIERQSNYINKEHVLQKINCKKDSESTYNGYGGTDFMKFRPCIDIHNGKVKQIVGGSLTDVQDQASENFVSEQDAAFYAELYKMAGIK